jgi:hypothetical protein
MIKTKPYVTQLIFQGNSLIDTSVNHVKNNQKYVTLTIYNSLRSIYQNLSLLDYSISGQNQIQINSKMLQQFNSSSVRHQDVVINMEGLNNIWHYPNKTAQEAFNDLLLWINHVSQFTNKIIICTISAVTVVGDTTDIFGRCQQLNQLIRENLTNVSICDIALDSVFSNQLATENMVNYDTDKVHWIKGGQDRFIQLITPYITALL